MLQATKLDSASLPRENRSRDPLQDLLEPRFAGILAHIVTGSPPPGPVPTPPAATKSPALNLAECKPRSEVAPPSGGPREAGESDEIHGLAAEDAAPVADASEVPDPLGEANKADQSPAIEEAPPAAGSVSKASPEAPEAPETPGAPGIQMPPEAARELLAQAATESAKTGQAAAGMALVSGEAPPAAESNGVAQSQGSTPALSASATAAPTAPPTSLTAALPKALPVAPEKAQVRAESAQVLPGSPKSTAQSAQIQAPAFSREDKTLDQPGPGLKLQFQTSGPVPAFKASWADLLYVPRVEVETPRHLFEAVSRTQAKDSAPSPETPVKTPDATATQDQNRSTIAADKETLAGVPLPKSEARAAAQGSGAPITDLVGAGGVSSEGAAKSVQASVTTPSLVLPKSMPLFSQVDGGVRWMIKNGAQSAEMQLQPESLGKVSVHLRVERGEVHARLWASESGAVPLLQSQKAILENSLKEQGLHLASFDLQQGSRGGDRGATERQAHQ